MGATGNASSPSLFWARPQTRLSGGTGTVKSVFDYGLNNALSGSYEVCWNYCNNGVALINSDMAFIFGGMPAE